MSFDQVHEQNNKIIKGLGGATSFLNSEDDSALIRWETVGPEVARIVSEFESSMINGSVPSSHSLKHHEDNDQFRTTFNKDVDTVYNAIPCNPFEMETLCALNNSKSFPPSVLIQLKKILPQGEENVKAFIKDRLIMQKVPINEKITKNQYSLLKEAGKAKKTQVNFGVALMNKLRSAVEHRPSKAAELFEGELYGVPPCFSVDCTNEMYHGTKSSIQERLPSSPAPKNIESRRKLMIVDASPLFRKLSNASVANFHEFGVVYYNYVMRFAEGFDRLDMTFDQYFQRSLKPGQDVDHQELDYLMYLMIHLSHETS